MQTQVTVIIVNYNSGARLAKCIAHLKAQRFENFDVIVVDNASTDSSIDVVRDDPAIALICADTNLGFAAANNLAVKASQADWVAFLNPDAYPEPDWLSELMAATARYPAVSAFGSTQIDALDSTRLDGAGDVYHAVGLAYRGHVGHPITHTPSEGECFTPCAAAALYRKSVFLDLGGFDERFFCYFEDVDLGFRLRLKGGAAIHVANAIVHHEGSAITGRRSAFSIYYGHRNRVWTYLLNMPLGLLILTAPVHLAINVILLFQFLGRGKAAPYARAMVDAAKALPTIWKQRQARQRERTASTSQIARALTWSPIKLIKREADIREYI